MTRTTKLVLAVVLLVAGFDIVTGVRLLVSDAPHLVNGADTLWARATPLVSQGEGAALLASLYGRLGAFSLHVGVTTAAWALFARRQPRLLTALLVIYLVTGCAFFLNDVRFFQATGYFRVKQALGALWALALVVQLLDRRRAAQPPL
jgi:hypothetical protein